MEFPLTQFIQIAKIENKSDEYVNEITKYVKHLESRNYPVIFSIEHLAVLMKIQSDFLKYLLEYPEENEKIKFDGYRLALRYNRFVLTKRKGGIRVIVAPMEDVKYIQKWILCNILEKFEHSINCCGFIKGKSIKDNAIPHSNANLVLKVDLLRFFDSIEEKRVFGCFKQMGYNGNLAYDLARLCTINHNEDYWKHLDKTEIDKLFENKITIDSRVLPQGAPTSPALANIIAHKMDLRFSKLADKLNFQYTRYADDLTFSIKEKGTLPSLRVIKKVIKEEGFILNDKKTRFLKRGEAQYVTGLTVTNDINLSKKYRKEIARHLFFCKKFGVENHLKVIRKKSSFYGFNAVSFHDWLYGHMCFIKSINQKAFNDLFEEYKKVDWLM